MRVLPLKKGYSAEEAAKIILRNITNCSESDYSLETDSDNENVVSDLPGVLEREPIMDNNESEVEVLGEDESSECKDSEGISDEDNVDANEVPVKLDFDWVWKKRIKIGITADFLSPECINFFEDVKQKQLVAKNYLRNKSGGVYLNIISSFLACINIQLHCKHFSQKLPVAQWTILLKTYNYTYIQKR